MLKFALRVFSLMLAGSAGILIGLLIFAVAAVLDGDPVDLADVPLGSLLSALVIFFAVVEFPIGLLLIFSDNASSRWRHCVLLFSAMLLPLIAGGLFMANFLLVGAACISAIAAGTVHWLFERLRLKALAPRKC